MRLVARDGFVDRRPRALELGVQNADLPIARQLHIRCTVSGVWCLLSTPVGRRSVASCACMPSRSCWARSCCQLVHATCVAFSSLARLHLPLRLALVRQQLVDPHRLLRQLHQTARGMQSSTMQLTYAMARPRGATTQRTAGDAMHDAAMSTSNNRRVQHMACSTQRTTCNRQHAG